MVGVALLHRLMPELAAYDAAAEGGQAGASYTRARDEPAPGSAADGPQP